MLTGLFQSNNLANKPRPPPIPALELAAPPIADDIKDGVGGVEGPPFQCRPLNPMNGDSNGE